MKRIVSLVGKIVLMMLLVGCGGNGAVSPSGGDIRIHQPGEQILDKGEALRFLEEGNKRFVQDKGISRTTNSEDREILSEGQKPFAVVVTCADSRVTPEMFFDQKLGDIFVIRNAGNIADYSALGSIEYAVEHLHVPLVVVVGHSMCGAVSGALSGGAFPENLQQVIDEINLSLDGSENLQDAIYSNIEAVCTKIRENQIVAATGATVVGAYYDIKTGEVTFSN